MPRKSSDAAGKKGTKKDADGTKGVEEQKSRVPAECRASTRRRTMLAPASDDEAATDSEGEWTTDKAGNTISKAEGKKEEEGDARCRKAPRGQGAGAGGAGRRGPAPWLGTTTRGG